MKEELIKMLASYLRLSQEEARRRFMDSRICETLEGKDSNLQYQPIEYVFTLLKQEIAEEDEDDYDDDFERQETMPEGLFVRSH
ncbi:hypothetical protein RCJ22_35805 [Vibrio sp. FNV 38]|jgi:hypothetical protein|nr:hypothetical protein [Vibrio sp. FNV 38]